MTPREPPILFLKFSGDGRKLFIGKRSGFKIYDLERGEVLHEYQLEDAYLVDLLSSTGVAAAVCLRRPAVLQLVDLRKMKEVKSLCYSDSIVNLASTGRYLVVCLEGSIEVLQIRGMKVLLSQKVKAGYGGICAVSLSASSESNYLAHPVGGLDGTINVVNIISPKVNISLDTHKSPLSAMAFHPYRNILATSSTKGTIIRLLSIPRGECLHELRRGLQRSANIYSLAFNENGSLLCCSSNTGTVHVFKSEPEKLNHAQSGSFNGVNTDLDDTESHSDADSNQDVPVETCNRVQSGWASYLAEWLPASIMAVPKVLYDSYMCQRSFLKARLPAQSKNCSHFTSVRGVQRLIVASSELGLYTFALETGAVEGECHSVSDPLSIDHL